MFELIFACAIGVTCPEAKTFNSLDDCHTGRNAHSTVIKPGEVIATCRVQKKLLPTTSGIVRGNINPSPAPITLHRLKFTLHFANEDTSTWYDKNMFSASACDAYAIRTVNNMMSDANRAKHKGDSITYKCTPVPSAI
jgi:hypothetical protein